jgi:MoxR-like ATPase
MSCTPESLAAAFAGRGYLADADLATAVFLSLELGRPLFLEGEAGVGKTAVGQTLALVTGGELIRLQCYEGLDAATALYEWDYPRQMLEIRLLEASGRMTGATSKDVFGEAFLIRRPLLRALQATAPPAPVLLIDEVDRADEEFEALLLELLSDFAVTVPEVGTIRAVVRPHVIITSNRTREVHDALKRRCLYHWIEYPTAERERAILQARMPEVADALAAQVVAFVQRLRSAEVVKAPGIAETLDWAAALTALGARLLDPDTIDRTLGVLLKYQEDVTRLRGNGARTLLAETRAAAGTGAEPRG